jgi:hypothetical protein
MRACDKQDGALAAARALHTCGDCLIEAHLLMRKWDIAKRVEEASATCGDADAACLAAFAAMFDAALPILERRAAAGTLDDTSHCPKEAVFFTALLSQIEPELDQQAHYGMCAAHRIGYDTVILAGFAAVQYVEDALYGRPDAVTRSGVLDAAALLRLCTVASTALQLATQLNARGRYVGAALVFMPVLSRLLTGGRAQQLSRAAWATPLVRAWEHTQRDGLLGAPIVKAALTHGCSLMIASDTSEKALAAARMAACTLRGCSQAACAARETYPAQFKLCGACKAAAYCSKEHQTADWPSHKAACKAARKEASAAAQT